MPSTLIQEGIVVCTLVAAFALFSGMRKMLHRRDEWSVGAAIGGGIVILTFSIIQVLVTYTNSWVKVTDVFRVVSYEFPPWGQLCVRAALALMALGGLVVFATGMRSRDAQVNVPAALLVIVMFISMASSLLHGDLPLQTFSLIYLCMLLACLFAPRGLGIHLGIGTVATLVAIASGIAVIVNKDFSVFECVAGHKCGILGFNFRGVLDNENALALYLALAMPFIYVAFGGWQGLVVTAYVAALIMMTGSRSGTLAAVITFAALALARPNLRRPTRAPARSAVLSLVLLGAFTVGLILPFVVDDPSEFSGRAALWQLARDALSDTATLVNGTGMFGWNHVHEAGLIDSSAVYSVHNQWLHVLFSTGVIGLVFFLGAIAILLWQSRHQYLAVIACVLLPCFILAITERPWPIDTGDWLCWAVPGALLCYPLTREGKPQRDDSSDSTAARNVAPVPIGARSSGPLPESGQGR